jgi:hypothetical protein
MQSVRRAQKVIHAVVIPHLMTAALAIRCSARPSFHEKLRQLVRKLKAKRAPTSALFDLYECGIRRKF